MAIEIRPLDELMAAEIRGVDLTRPVDGETRDTIGKAYLEHRIVVFRGQSMSPAQVVEATRLFGEPSIHFLKKFQLKEHPEIVYLSSVDLDVDGDGRPIVRGTDWHSDMAYMRVPARATCMFAVEHPLRGGATRFADAERAYETLPEATKRRIEGLQAVHEFASNRPGYVKKTEEEQRATPPVAHPVVRTHPETGRKAIYVQPGDTKHIVGLPSEESAALLEELYEHMFQSRFQYAYQYAPGDFIAWDNPGLVHAATGDLERGDRRLMHRTMTVGSVPF